MPSPDHRSDTLPRKSGIGQPLRRLEDARFLTGRGRFIEDLDFPRQCHGAVVMSPHAHALIRGIDTSKALASPGVLCVLTGADAVAEKLGGFPSRFMPDAIGFPAGYRTIRAVLAADRVRCVGERVAFVVAETLAQARDAAELVEVDYEPLPCAPTLEHALAEGAPRVWEDCPGNVSYRIWFGDPQATDAVFAKAPHVVCVDTLANRITAATIEPRGALGVYDAGEQSWLIHTSSQNPHGVRAMLAQDIFRVPETRMRALSLDVGGGFGMKSSPYPEDALVLWASRRLGRPVKWIATRCESLAGDAHARDQRVRGELALEASGKILAIRVKAWHSIGAYTVAATMVPTEMSLRFIPNVYDVQTMYLETHGVFTHTSPLTSYRGAGRPEALTLIERLMDLAAIRLGIDPVEMRRRNFIRPESMPYRTVPGFEYDSGEFERVMQRCLARADWNAYAARKADSERRGLVRGRSLSCYIEQGGRFNDRMELRCDPGGAVSIVAGTHSHGQGHATTYAQLVSEWLGIPIGAIRFVQGDTDQVPFGRGSFAARSSLIGGCALKLAADALIAKGRRMAARLMEAAEADIGFENGEYRIAGTDRRLSFMEAARAFYRPMGLPQDLGLGLEASAAWEASPPNFPNGCHACEVEIDPQTGAVRVDRYAVVDDLGRVINPMICEGQIHGGLAQGIGQALMEEIVYESESGQLLSGSFADYCMPRADDFPSFDVDYVEVPCRTNPLGVKGVGEAGAVASPPAIVNAVLDALRPLGVEHIEMPVTPARVWEALEAARARGGPR